MRLSLSGTQPYWFHEALIRLLQERTGWPEEKAKTFLAQNTIVNLNGLSRKQVLEVVDRLQISGFNVHLERAKNDYRVFIAMPYQTELEALRKQAAELTARLEALEAGSPNAAGNSPEESPVYQELKNEAAISPEETEALPPENFSKKAPSDRVMTESNIGRYWLSRIGVFSLLLGIALFISYSFQFIGAWGKLFTGIAVSLALISGGNYAARFEKYRQWAMALIGGGWAILYFTAFAAHHIPTTRVITSPLNGLFLLLIVSTCSIAQSLRYRSAVLVVFSYFLAYVAITLVTVSIYTLAASSLLAASILVVTRRTGWNWLALAGLAAAYAAHFAWFSAQVGNVHHWTESYISDVFLLPWSGEIWNLYPLVDPGLSRLHIMFLFLYWLLFTALGFFKGESKKEEEVFVLSTLVANHLIFIICALHHLHIYFPDLKYFFPLAMSVFFLGLTLPEKKLGRPLFADLYLAFAATLLCLAVPMYFDGAWITYGWCAAALSVCALGLRYQKKILCWIGWFFAAGAAVRLLAFDYREQDLLFHYIFPVKGALPLYGIAALSFLGLREMHRKASALSSAEKRFAGDVFLSAAAVSAGIGVLIGGWREGASFFWIAEGAVLMTCGLAAKNRTALNLAWISLFLAVLRLAFVDVTQPLVKLVMEPAAALRILAAGAGILALLVLASRLRGQTLGKGDRRMAEILTAASALLVLGFLYDRDLSSWVSILWGLSAFGFLTIGFTRRDLFLRWCGIGFFALVMLRLLFHDFRQLETLYRIISFIGLGGVFIAASFLYSYYSRILLAETKR